MSTKTGIDADIDAAARAQQEARYKERETELRQGDLLDPLTPEEIAEAREDMGFGASRLSVLAEARRRKLGRPPGARNRSTDDLRRYLLEFGPDPLVGAMILQGTPTEVLMELSGKGYLECLDRQIRCRELVAPYIHGKKPIAVDLTFSGVADLVIQGVTHSEAEMHELLDGDFMEVPDDKIGGEQ